MCEGRQNTQIWVAIILIGVSKTLAQNVGSVRFAQVEDQLHCVSGRIRQPSF
jgi:hypothetical protein